ncbi:MAG: helix-turn-helix domain-containing protein [Clostridiales bacterium]|nr:helix-turn-helix domain-containing protein [Clostridiales bacterium]MDU3490892.1 helix-turn-helix domain-containing protein [Clostridiales bacterium]
MDLANSTTITPNRERGQHLTFGDRVSIRIYLNLKYSYRRIAEELNRSPSTSNV